MTEHFYDCLPIHKPLANEEHNLQLIQYYSQSLLFAPVDLMISYHYARLASSLPSQSSSALYAHAMQWFYLLKYFIFQEVNDNEHTHLMVSWMRENIGKQVDQHPFQPHVQLYSPPHFLIKHIKTHSHIRLKNQEPLPDLMTAYHYNIRLPCKYDSRFNGLVFGSVIKPIRPIPLGLYKTPITDENNSLKGLINHYQECCARLKDIKESKKRTYESDMMDLE
eukprot:NODE_705_length_4989_cov_0.075460.p3 type:complete len:222 gc:universal NODE_705_length_4989_cov_0.075460:3575-4240(+)